MTMLPALLDWERGYEPLDSELPKFLREGEGGTKRADRLVKAEKDGMEKGIHRSLRAVLKGKFQDKGETLATEVSMRDAAWVESALERVAAVDTLEKASAALGLGA